jgi:probable phosphoglycerate mutase
MPSLKNRYFVMRHGQSQANTAGLIVSHPDNGLNNYGLSEQGRQQVKTGIAESELSANIRLFSSDFKRARETAEIVHQYLHCQHPVHFETRLRERFFGDLELGNDSRYAEIWTADKKNPTQSEQGAETVHSVMKRAFAKQFFTRYRQIGIVN